MGHYQYGILGKYLLIIKIYSDNYTARIGHNGQFYKPIHIETGVKQACVMLPIIFLVMVDCVMRNTTDGKTRINWNTSTKPEGLEFVNDVCLITRYKYNIQTNKAANVAKEIGLHINKDKTELLKRNTEDEDLYLVVRKYYTQNKVIIMSDQTCSGLLKIFCDIVDCSIACRHLSRCPSIK